METEYFICDMSLNNYIDILNICLLKGALADLCRGRFKNC
jgi:hypothetical protein